MLRAGDVVRFAAGVAYRGTVRVTASGDAGAPIRFLGDDGAGGSRAIMHGGEPLGAGATCANATACGGNANYGRMLSFALPTGRGWTDWLVSGDRLLGVGQYPQPEAPIAMDHVSDYTAISESALSQLKRGYIRFVGQAPSAGSSIALWGEPNVLSYPKITVTGTTIKFSPTGYKPYTDRPNRYAVVNDPKRISFGEFAMTNGRIYVWPVGTDPFWIGGQRQGFILDGVSNVTVEGFRFIGFSSTTGSSSGIPIQAPRRVDNVLIARNSFGPMALRNGQGAINLSGVGAVTVTNNSFDNNVFGSGVRVGNAPGPVVIRCNRFAHLGRTGVSLLNVLEAHIQRNDMQEVNGLHGDGVAAYLDNRVVEITDNVMSDTIRPVTMHGNGNYAPYFADPTPPATTITGNVFEAATKKVTAVISWGAQMTNVAMTGNTIVGGGFTARFQPTDVNITVADNVTTTESAAIDAKRTENAAICGADATWPHQEVSWTPPAAN